MGKYNRRYQQMERYMTLALIADAALFLVCLLFAGLGMIWLKVLLAVLIIILSGLCLGFLYISKELLRQRSLWMSVAAAAIGLCLLFSLLLNFPSPNKYKKFKKSSQPAAALNLNTQQY